MIIFVICDIAIVVLFSVFVVNDDHCLFIGVLANCSKIPCVKRGYVNLITRTTCRFGVNLINDRHIYSFISLCNLCIY